MRVMTAPLRTANHRARWLLPLALAACAVSPAPGPGEGDGGADLAPLQCGSKTACGGRCVDLQGDPTSCGACDRTCVIPNGAAGCSQGECVIAACVEGYFDSDRKVANGCEAQSDCQPGGECRTACDSAGATRCVDGVAQCQPPAETCNGQDDNCDGRCDEGPLAGCRAGVHRAVGGGGHLFTTDLAAATAPPYTIEATNYFHIYRAAVPGTQPVYLCPKPNGKSFLTSSASCEVLNVAGRLLGYWATEPRCGAQPLYRLYHGGAGDHFYTVSDAERKSAVEQSGYQFESVAAYVWPSP